MGKQSIYREGNRETISGLTLRPETEQDEDLLYRIYASTRADEMALVDWSEAEKESFLRMQFNAQRRYYLSTYQDARFDIIEQEETPVGRLYVHRLHDEIRVIDIALLPEHRGRGLGGGLLRAVLEEAAAVGKSVYVSVERFNPAMRLYQRLGFVAITNDGVYRLMKWSPPTAGEPANPAKA